MVWVKAWLLYFAVADSMLTVAVNLGLLPQFVFVPYLIDGAGRMNPVIGVLPSAGRPQVVVMKNSSPGPCEGPAFDKCCDLFFRDDPVCHRDLGPSGPSGGVSAVDRILCHQSSVLDQHLHGFPGSR